eukprot:TRINITY_DN6521_c0_g1_i3.p1 TRINITY_DN6521_c0_g1~~TRINITY_DN6521_c0_g1_i3.p1  ORF type:complete len:181 (+),score=16.03 TRINITY_DN6521_c0_g1_i3:386-928(+)
MPEAILRGDLSSVTIGKYSSIGINCVVRPPYKRIKGGITFFPVTIGDYVQIEDDCVISAASVGSYVQIGKNCVIGPRCIIKDCVRIEDNSVLPPDTVVAPFSVYGSSETFGGKGSTCAGSTFIEELPESWQSLQQEFAISCYNQFKGKLTGRPLGIEPLCRFLNPISMQYNSRILPFRMN